MNSSGLLLGSGWFLGLDFRLAEGSCLLDASGLACSRYALRSYASNPSLMATATTTVPIIITAPATTAGDAKTQIPTPIVAAAAPAEATAHLPVTSRNLTLSWSSA